MYAEMYKNLMQPVYYPATCREKDANFNQMYVKLL
jgi:hypothetical protein